MKRKRLLTLLGSVCLALVLALPLVASCGPATPEEAAGEIAALESKLATEKSKVSSLQGEVSDLEDEILELRKPAEKITIRFNEYHVAGILVDGVELFVDQLETISNGRIEVILTYGDSLAPVTEHVAALENAVFDLGTTWPGWGRSVIPVADIDGGYGGTLRTEGDWWGFNYKYGFEEIMQPEYAKHSVYRVLSWSHLGPHLIAKVPIPHISDLAGLKLMIPGSAAPAMELLGVSAIEVTGPDIYSALATGLIDGTMYSSPATHYKMGLHEVTKYWEMPALKAQTGSCLLANLDFWNSLPERYRELISTLTVDLANYEAQESWYQSMDALMKAQEAGVTLYHWDANDMATWSKAMVDSLEPTDDPALIEGRELLFDYMRMLGYLD